MIALRRLLSLVALTSLLLASPSTFVAIAADDASHHGDAAAEHADSAHHAPAVGDLLFPAINFALYLVVVFRFVVPAMREYLRRRRTEVVQSEAESSALLATAQKGLTTAQARLAQLATEANGIQEDLVAIATRQGDRLKAQAEETGTRRLRDASLLAEHERRRALGDLRAELASAAVVLAQNRIRGALTADDQRVFVKQFLKDASAQ